MVVEFNDLHQPLGDADTQMQSYLRAITGQNVPIDNPDWCQVSKELENKI